jgi:DNA repair protein RadC
MAIKDWPADDRPREKLIERGAATLTDAELLAIFLRVGVTGYSAVDLARIALERFGSLRGLIAASVDEFSSIKGFGEAKYAQLQAAVELARRALSEQLRASPILNAPQTVKDYLRLTLAGEQSEVFLVLYLDAQHKLLATEIPFRGTLTQASVYPREIVKSALARNAAAVVFAHNHPSGNAQPSDADRRLTENLKSALSLVDVRVIDHVVVGDGQAFSFAEAGWLR